MNDYTKTYCNPIKLPDYPYCPAANPKPLTLRNALEIPEDPMVLPEKLREVLNFGFAPNPRLPFRETADPTCMLYEGKWYLYPSCGMAYVSSDFIHWEKQEISPSYIGHAPTVEHYRGKFLFSANSAGLWMSDSPLGPLTFIHDFVTPSGEIVIANDPMLFADDDGALYFYWGMDDQGIRGAKMDPEKPWQMVTEPKILIPFCPEHEWERLGEHNEDYGMTFIEGAWMVKVNGTYYLTYSCAGTEFSTYAMGCYKSKSPLDGFVCQKNNPVSRKTCGLIRGTGHGSIVRGPENTLWVFYTVAMTYAGDLERRIGFDPAGIDENGDLYTLAGSEIPQWAPGIKRTPEKGNSADLDCISARKGVRATSFKEGRDPLYALDESMLTWWQPGDDDECPILEIAFRGRYEVSAFRILWRENGLDPKNGVPGGAIRYTVETSMDCEQWITACDKSESCDDYAVDYQVIPTVTAKFIRIRILGAPKGIHPGLIDFSVFGRSVYK